MKSIKINDDPRVSIIQKYIKDIFENFKINYRHEKKFIEGKSPPDFAAEDYEINYKGRTKINDLSELAKKDKNIVKIFIIFFMNINYEKFFFIFF